jgi:hypothetical protein
MIKLLQTGHALASLEQIRRFGLDKGVFPVLDAVLRQAAPGLMQGPGHVDDAQPLEPETGQPEIELVDGRAPAQAVAHNQRPAGPGVLKLAVFFANVLFFRNFAH